MTADASEGALVGGRFRLGERLDGGGFATVWRATDEHTGAPVAVKCGRDDVDRDAVREHFRRELAAFRRLTGALVPGSIVQFVDGAVGEAAAYVAVELLDGGSLADADLEWGRPALAAVGRPVCNAVDFLHRHGVVHLDLKPANVVLRAAGPPAVLDFNTAVAVGEGAAVFHQDPFKPPELTPTDRRDDPAGPRSDVYALGALLSYLLTGEAVSFDAESTADWAPIDPRERGADCPPELAAHVRRATAPDPDDRFADASDLYAAVAPHLDPTGRVGRLTHERSDRRVRVHPGTTLGRWAPGEAVSDVLLSDPDRHLSPDHAVLVADGDGWALRDRSLNGTHVDAGDGWRFALSAAGAERQRAAGRSPPSVPESLPLEDGARIAPVDAGLGFTLRFAAEV